MNLKIIFFIIQLLRMRLAKAGPSAVLKIKGEYGFEFSNFTNI
jgi:hypothetical protein